MRDDHDDHGDHDEPIEPSPRIVHPTIAAAPVRRASASEAEDDTIAASPGAAKPSSRPAALPDRLGRYLVLERIGEGGMGMVVAAYDPELERKLALKVLRTDRDDEDGRARLLREAQAMAKLSHPNVVPVFDVGIVDDRVFVAMELVRGQTLWAWLHRERRPWPAVLERFVAAGRGLRAAHEAGLVHRDLKPANVLVSDAGRVLVTDFGLARAVGDAATRPTLPPLAHEPSSLSTSLTRAGALVGTPAYMAPELFAARPADARSDQFAFCVSLYEGLYGEMPFPTKTVHALVHALAKGHVPEPPPGAPKVPQWLRKVVLRGLRPKPEDRWEDMAALLDALDRDPTRARRRAVAGVAIAAVVGVGAWQWQARAAARCAGLDGELGGIWDDGRREAVEAALRAAAPAQADDTWPRVRDRVDAYAGDWAALREQGCQAHARGDASDHTHELQLGCLAARRRDLEGLLAVLADADAQVAERAVTAVSSLPALGSCADPLALRSELEPPGDPTTAASVEAEREQLARVQGEVAAGRYAAALSLCDEALARAEGLGYRPLLAEAQLLRGLSLAGLGSHDAAAAALRLAWTHALASRHDALAARVAIEAIQVVGHDLARVDEGLAWADEAAAMLDRTGRDPQLVASHLHHQGGLLLRAGRYAEAATAFERAAAQWAATLGPEHPQVATAYAGLGEAQVRQGQLLPAATSLEHALAIQEAALGPSHPTVAMSRSSLGNAYDLAGRHAEAQAQHEQALAAREAALGPEHPLVASSLTNLGVSLLTQGHLDQAEARFRRAIEIREVAQGPAHPDLSDPVIDLGNVFFAQGRVAEAGEQYQRALAIDLGALGPAHPNVALTRANLGAALWRLGRLDEAEQQLTLAAADMARTLGDDHPSRAAPLHTLGEVALDRGQPALARDRLDAAARLAAGTWPPAELAKLELARARARFALGDDPAAARAEIEAAAAALVEAGPSYAADAARADAWLREHPRAPDPAAPR